MGGLGRGYTITSGLPIELIGKPNIGKPWFSWILITGDGLHPPSDSSQMIILTPKTTSMVLLSSAASVPMTRMIPA